MPSPASVPLSTRTIGFERFLFFSDAVFAIAITLLVLDLRAPLERGRPFVLAPVIPNLVGFGLSFYVVGRYWLAHHQLFETIQASDQRLLVANLCFLATIAFLPFPTSVVAEASVESGAVTFYALSVAAVGLLLIGLALAARRPALMRPGETPGGTAAMVVGMAAAPTVFLASAALATDAPRAALWMLWSLIPIGWLFDLAGRILRRKIDGAAETPPGRATG